VSKDEEVVFFQEQFLKQLDHNQFLAKQLSDLHLYIMNNAFYNAGGTMTLWFKPSHIDDIIYRQYNEEDNK